jgi:hypothetical protein
LDTKLGDKISCTERQQAFLDFSLLLISFWIEIWCIIYNKPTRCNSGSIVFINNYKYALHVSDALCVHHQEHYKL